MKRRAFVEGMAAVKAAPLAAEPQQAGKVWRLGVLDPGVAVSDAEWLKTPFAERLHDVGYVNGRNLLVQRRCAGGRIDQLPELAAELVRLKIDVLFTISTPGVEAARKATTDEDAGERMRQAKNATDSGFFATSPSYPRSFTPAQAALAVPFVTKLTFECPQPHLDALRASIQAVTQVLIIGWRGAEKHFVNLLQQIPQQVPCLIVAGSYKAAQDIGASFAKANVPLAFDFYNGGFSDFVVGPHGYASLKGTTK